MSFALSAGVVCVLIGGILNGSFAAPMKTVRGWRWENIWLVYSISGLLVLPWIAAFATVPHLSHVIQATSWKSLGEVLLFGAGWGLGSVLFGLGIERMGLAVGYGIIVGLNAPLGTLFPLLILHPEQLHTAQGRELLRGTLIVLAGIVLCAIAAGIRERRPADKTRGKSRSALYASLLICVISGIFSPMINFSFVFGAEMQQRAVRAGASLAMAANSVWAVALTAGFVVNAGYCVFLLNRNRTWSLFRGDRAGVSHWFNSSMMGLLCFGSFVVYGVGATVLGSMGGIVGWPLFLSMSLITSSLLGALSGEWRNAPRRVLVYSLTGIAVLIAAIVLIAGGGAR